MLRLRRCRATNQRRLDESPEQRMRIERPRFQLRVELASEEPWMSLQFHDLDQVLIGRKAGREETDAFEALAIVIVHFVAMAMALGNVALAIKRERERTRLDHAWPRAEAHGAALLRDIFLRVHDVDDLIRRLGIDLGRVRLGQAEQIPRGLDDHHVEAIADAEDRHAILARVTNRANLASRAAFAEAPGDNDRVGLGEALDDAAFFEFLGIDIVGDDLGLVSDSAVSNGLVHALVRINRVHVLADDRDIERDLGILRGLDDALPLAQVRLPGPDVELLAN